MASVLVENVDEAKRDEVVVLQSDLTGQRFGNVCVIKSRAD